MWIVLALSFSGWLGPGVVARTAAGPRSHPLATPGLPPALSDTPTQSPTATALPTATSTVVPTPTPTMTPTPTALPGSVEPIPIGEDTLVIALLGRDTGKGSGLWRTDSIILTFIDRKAQKVSLLSIPRDLWVYMPRHGWNRINTADALGERTGYPGGGTALLKDTMRYNLGLSFDHYVRVDFQGFVRIIDAVGGITVDVGTPFAEWLPNPDSPPDLIWITVPEGPYHMDGDTALIYCRSRIRTSDFARSRRQQEVLIALWKSALTVETLTKAPQLWTKFNDAFDTDLTMVDAIRIAQLVHGIELENVHSQALDYAAVRDWTTPQGAQVLLPRLDVIQQTVLDLLSGPQ